MKQTVSIPVDEFTDCLKGGQPFSASLQEDAHIIGAELQMDVASGERNVVFTFEADGRRLDAGVTEEVKPKRGRPAKAKAVETE